MNYETYKQGMEFAAKRIREYGIEFARNVINGVLRWEVSPMGDYAQGYLDMVEMYEAIHTESKEENDR